MKTDRILIIAVLAIVLSAALSGCSKQLPVAEHGDIQSLDGFSVTTEFSSCRKGEPIYCILENRTDSVVYYNQYPLIEVFQNGTWCRIPYRDHVAFQELLCFVQPGKSVSIGVSTDIFDYRFPAGRYRVFCEYSPDEYEYWRGWEYGTFAEFDIVKRNSSGDSGDYLELNSGNEEALPAMKNFVDKVFLQIPQEIRVLTEDQEKLIISYTSGPYGEDFAVQKGKETLHFGFVSPGPDGTGICLSNLMDLREAAEESLIAEEGKDFVFLGDCGEEISELLRNHCDALKEGSGLQMKVYLSKDADVMAAVMMPQTGLTIGYRDGGMSEILNGLYNPDELRLIGIRRLSDTEAQVIFETADGGRTEKVFDVKLKGFQ